MRNNEERRQLVEDINNWELTESTIWTQTLKLHNGHKYATVIIDLETGHILHLAHGRKKAVVYEFIDRVGMEWMSSVKAAAYLWIGMKNKTLPNVIKLSLR